MRTRAERAGLAIIFMLMGTTIQGAATQITPVRSLLSLSKEDQRLSIVDPATLQIIARVDVGIDPHEVVAAPDGRTAYVSNMDNSKGHEIHVVDLVAQRPLPTIETGPLKGPHGLNYVAGKLWFTAQGAKAVARYDPGTHQVDWIVGTGQNWTHMIHVVPDGNTFLTTNVTSGTVSEFEYVSVPPSSSAFGFVPAGRKSTMEWLQTVIPLGEGVEGMAVSLDEKELWTASPATGDIYILAIATKQVTRIPGNVKGANRLIFTNDGRVLVSSIRNGEITEFDASSRKELRRATVCSQATGMAIDQEQSRVFVSCSAEGYVAAVNLDSLAKVAEIHVGGRPDGLGWAVRR